MMQRAIIFLLAIAPLWLVAQTRTYSVPNHVQSSDYLPNRIVVKVKSSSGFSINQSLKLAQGVQASSIQPLQKASKNQRSSSSLSSIYFLDLKRGEDPIRVCNELLKQNEIEYAEVLFYEELFHTPNDPFAHQTSGNQDYLLSIHAYDAWDITTGNSDVLIGIVDTGMDVDHEDLISKYYINPNETVDGVDNDANGYVDDVLGYDFADNDNDPNADTDINSSLNHGTHVGGIAGAHTNNDLGIAGVGYDCTLVPLKGFTTTSALSTGVWEGVLYAADNGFDVVNLSWGNTNGFSQFFQDIINYCVLEKDLVVIAAAGNTHGDIDFYPASYEHVISVGAATLSDTKWSSGTYSDHIDVMAPGVSILSTQKNDTYGSDNGSSHASPMVAGVAGLVRSAFPLYNARQVMEQIRATSDDIYDITENQDYLYKLGKGRLNAFRAVSETAAKSIRVQNLEYDNGFGTYAFYGDTVTLSFDLINYLSKVEQPTISFESDSPYLTFIDDFIEPGLMQPMEELQDVSIRIVLSESTPPETEINIRFFMEDGSYSDFQNFSFTTSPDFLEVSTPLLRLTSASNGDLGLVDDYSVGNGLTFDDNFIGDYHGLLMGNNSFTFYDNIPSAFDPLANDGDFIETERIKFYEHPVIGPYAFSQFRSWDDDFLVEQSILPGISDDFIVLEYRIVNKSGEDKSDFHIGFFSDQDLPNGSNNVTWSTDEQSLIYSDEAESTLSALGSIMVSSEYVALNMQDFNGHTQDVGSTFSNTDKFDFLDGANISTAGEMPGGNDVAGIIKTTLANFPNNSDHRVGFILSVAESSETLSSNLEAARAAYLDFVNNPEVSETWFSCEGGQVILDPDGTSFNFYEDATATTLIASGQSLVVDNITSDTSIYVQNIDSGYPNRLTRISIEIIDNIAQFEASTDTLYLDDPTVNLIQFEDQSYLPIGWLWDFGNGEQSTSQNPVANYQNEGTFLVSLTTESDLGCSGEYTREIVVSNRPDASNLDPFGICQGESIELTHPTDEYAIYNSQGSRVAIGSSIQLGPFNTDSTLLIADRINQFESVPQSVHVTIDPISAAFTIYPDTLSSNVSALFRFTGQNADEFDWRIDGNLISTSSEFSATVSSEFELELIARNTDCSAVSAESISLNSSPIPFINDVQLCLGEDLILKPENGIYFGFYEDIELTQLLHKGTQLQITEVNENLVVFIVGLDNILPSEPIMATISVVDFESAILAQPAFLDLSTSSTVQFSGSNIVSAIWYVNDELVETALNPILFFNEAGFYDVRLVGLTSAGCTIEETIQYEVKGIVTGIVQNNLNIYPNPTSGLVQIDGLPSQSKISILDISGKELKSNLRIRNRTINLDFPKGIYFLKIDLPNKTLIRKISLK